MLYPLSYEGGARAVVIEPTTSGQRSGGGPAAGQSARRRAASSVRLSAWSAERAAASIGCRRRRCRAGVRRRARGAARDDVGRGPRRSSPRPRRDGVEGRARKLQAVERRPDHADDPGARDRAPDDPPALVREVHLELVGVGEREHREQPDPLVAWRVHRGGHGDRRCDRRDRDSERPLEPSGAVAGFSVTSTSGAWAEARCRPCSRARLRG